MAEVKLNTTTSIVDFLKSQGKPSDYGSRETLYNSLGLNSRLGQYTGSSPQNTAFLKQLSSTESKTDLKTPTVPITPTSPQPTPITPAAPTTAADALSTFGISPDIFNTPTAEQLTQSALSSEQFKATSERIGLKNLLATSGAEVQKQELAAKTSADTRRFIDSMGRRGLFFSGETETGIASLAQSLAASQLGVDRELASKLLESDFDLRDAVFKQIEKVTTDAKSQRKEALDALEKVGLTIVGNQVVPTLAAQREERQIQSEARQTKTAEFNRLATEERLRLSEEAGVRAEARLSLAEDRAAGNGVITSGGLRIQNTAVGKAAQTLDSTRGADGWVDPNLYEGMYYEWVNQGGLPQDFTSTFPPKAYINPENDTILPLLRNKQTDALGPLF